MDAEGERRLHDTLDSISGGIGRLEVQVGKVETKADATNDYCESISERVKDLDKNGTRLCKTNEVEITNLKKRVDTKKPLIVGGASVAGVIGVIQGVWMWLTKGQ